MKRSRIDYSLYLVTDRPLLGGRSLYDCVAASLAGGVTVLQLREKEASSREFFKVAMQLKGLAAQYKVPFIINDRLDIALAVDADGLHIGQDDLPLPVARRLLGPEKIIGISAGTVDEACLAVEQGADYLGVGAVYPTGTKTDADAVSLDELRRIKSAVNVPVVGIGGINARNISEVMTTGIDGVAVVSAIICAADPRAAASRLKQLVQG